MTNMQPNDEDPESDGSREQSRFIEDTATKIFIPGLFRDREHVVESSWEFPKGRLLNLKTVGSGNFGTVKKALALPFHSTSGQQYIPVAVKMLKGL